jgi:hypothetical protein
MKYKSYEEAASEPNIIVDGAANRNTVLTLSHWPRSGTPSALLADTSAAIALKYLETPEFHVTAGVVSNNHFDEDGLLGIYAILNPDFGFANRELMLDAAAAGDFSVYRRREAARIAMTVKALGYGADGGYERLLPMVPELISNISAFEPVWRKDDVRLTTTEDLIERNLIVVEEKPDLDLAVLRAADGPGSTQPMAEWHECAMHGRTERARLVLIQGRQFEFRYRYESWVQFQSRRVLPRVDLQPLAQELNEIEESTGHWVFEGVGSITPSLHFESELPSSIEPESIVPRLEHHLRIGAPAWNPYGGL